MRRTGANTAANTTPAIDRSILFDPQNMSRVTGGTTENMAMIMAMTVTARMITMIMVTGVMRTATMIMIMTMTMTMTMTVIAERSQRELVAV